MKVQSIILTVLFTCLAPSFSYSYDVVKLTEMLSLTTSQKAEISVLRDNFYKKLKRLENSRRYNSETKKMKEKRLIEQHKVDIAAVLTPQKVRGFEAFWVQEYESF